MVCLIALWLAAIDFGVGVRGGAPATSALEGESQEGPYQMVYGVTLPFSGYQAVDHPYTVGPTATVGLPRHFSLQFDALYKRYGFNSALPLINTPSSGVWAEEQWARVSQWTYSAQARYKWGFLVIGAGVALPQIASENSRYRYTRRGLFDRESHIGTGTSDSIAEVSRRNGFGVIASVGAEWRVGRLRFNPEIRYTRVTRRMFEGSLPGGPVYSRENQVDILVGVLGGTR
ncbi:MAG: hypothetical protein IT168_09470 [Bryobacterales bacterium]|nr:hypothetical protein [Bryobacterales bacterium]